MVRLSDGDDERSVMGRNCYWWRAGEREPREENTLPPRQKGREAAAAARPEKAKEKERERAANSL